MNKIICLFMSRLPTKSRYRDLFLEEQTFVDSVAWVLALYKDGEFQQIWLQSNKVSLHQNRVAFFRNTVYKCIIKFTMKIKNHCQYYWHFISIRICPRVGLSATLFVRELVCPRVRLSATWRVRELVVRDLVCPRLD